MEDRHFDGNVALLRRHGRIGKCLHVHKIVLQKWVENKEASPFKTGSDPEVFRGKKSGGTGFYMSDAVICESPIQSLLAFL